MILKLIVEVFEARGAVFPIDDPEIMLVVDNARAQFEKHDRSKSHDLSCMTCRPHVIAILEKAKEVRRAADKADAELLKALEKAQAEEAALCALEEVIEKVEDDIAVEEDEPVEEDDEAPVEEDDENGDEPTDEP